MDSYQRVQKTKEPEASEPNVIKLTAKGKRHHYIAYALSLLETDTKTVILKAMGHVITNAVTVAEILKRRVLGLHQITELGSLVFQDVYEPLVEGLKVVELERIVSSISITLSLEALDTNRPGYQAPLPSSEVSEQDVTQYKKYGRGNRRRKQQGGDRDEKTKKEEGRSRKGGRNRNRHQTKAKDQSEVKGGGSGDDAPKHDKSEENTQASSNQADGGSASGRRKRGRGRRGRGGHGTSGTHAGGGDGGEAAPEGQGGPQIRQGGHGRVNGGHGGHGEGRGRRRGGQRGGGHDAGDISTSAAGSGPVRSSTVGTTE